MSVYVLLVPALGILIISLVMLRGTFSKITAYLGVATGICGIISVVGPLIASTLGTAAVITAILTVFWVLFVGYKLYTQTFAYKKIKNGHF
jgi:hypothetical protein